MADPLERLGAALSGRYVIEQEIGQGGMATVYVAHDIRHDRPVALKVLRPELAAVVGSERFLAEIRTTANLQHPHILPLFDSGEADGFLYYVMPYVEGETLRGRIDREKQMGVGEAVTIAQKVADALDYAHEHGVVHRDIKPANILLSPRGEPLVADFGIALAVASAGGGRITETGLSLGTPHYMSPEQATGDRDVDPRSDVYALACVLYEMLAGQPPFHAPTAQAVLIRVLTADVSPITILRRTVPEHVEGALAKGLEKLPADRFESAAAFADALGDPTFTYRARKAPAPYSGAVAAPTLPAQTTPWYRDWRIAGAVGVAVLAILWGFLGSSAPPVAEGVPTRSLIASAGVIEPRSVAVSRSGRLFAVDGEAQDGTLSIFLRGAGDEAFRQLPGTQNGIQPTFSPDEQWIAYRVGAEATLYKVAVLGGAPRPILTDRSLNPRVASWGDDGYIYFRAAEGNEIYRVADVGGNPESLHVADAPVQEIEALPGGRGVLFTDLGLDRTMVWDARTREAREVITNGTSAIYSHSGHLVYADGEQGLWAVPFDLDRLETRGNPIPVVSGVTTDLGIYADFDLSENGTLVYRAGGGVGAAEARIQELLVVPFEGEPSVLPLDPRAYRNAAWSPDGASIAFSALEPGVTNGQTRLFVYNVELRTATRQLTYEGTQGWPVWSPDGSRLVYTSSDAQGGGSMGSVLGADLYLKAVYDDSDPIHLVDMMDNQYPYEWTEDDHILFTSDVGPSSNLVWVTPDPSSDVQTYLDADDDLGSVKVSPDGRYAAFASDETGVFDIFVRSFPDPRQPVQVSRGGGDRPRWAPDGSAIYYWKAGGEAGDTLMRAEVETEPTFAVLRTSPVLSGDYALGTWDLHPDGDRIVVARAISAEGGEEAPEQRLVVVVNWFSELSAAMGGGN